MQAEAQATAKGEWLAHDTATAAMRSSVVSFDLFTMNRLGQYFVPVGDARHSRQQLGLVHVAVCSIKVIGANEHCEDFGWLLWELAVQYPPPQVPDLVPCTGVLGEQLGFWAPSGHLQLRAPASDELTLRSWRSKIWPWSRGMLTAHHNEVTPRCLERPTCNGQHLSLVFGAEVLVEDICGP